MYQTLHQQDEALKSEVEQGVHGVITSDLSLLFQFDFSTLKDAFNLPCCTL